MTTMPRDWKYTEARPLPPKFVRTESCGKAQYIRIEEIEWFEQVDESDRRGNDVVAAVHLKSRDTLYCTGESDFESLVLAAGHGTQVFHERQEVEAK